MKELEIFLAEPRGFCSGVVRAIALVEKLLEETGAPVYVRHEIVHNRHVVEDLKARGVIFIDDWEEITQPDRPVIFSAHGVSKAVEAEAAARGLKTYDATCPLVEKVHRNIRRFYEEGMEIVLIGQPHHAEVEGTAGQCPDPSQVHIISSAEEAEELALPAEREIGVVTQTTLAVDRTAAIIEVLRRRFPRLHLPPVSDICYATTHRQQAVKALAARCPTVVIIGSANSSNSRHLRETALAAGAKTALLIDDYRELDLQMLETPVGVSAGASAPEHLVEELLAFLQQHYDNVKIRHVKIN